MAASGPYLSSSGGDPRPFSRKYPMSQNSMAGSQSPHTASTMPTNLHMDLRQPVVIDLAAAPWIASPSAGVERKPLEREGREQGRTTSLVRYLPGSAFSSHTHGGGEEFFVVEGTFCDDSGEFPEGTYVRNPVGSSHAPSSPHGCTIFVKLCQMNADEQEQTVVDTAARDGARVELYADAREVVDLVQLEPGESLPADGAELVLLSGRVQVGAATHEPLVWLRHPAGPSVEVRCLEAASLWRKRGHLPRV